MRAFRNRSARLVALVAVVGMLAGGLLQPADAATTPATVEDPSAGLHGPWFDGCCYFEWGDADYAIQEYLVSGTAKTYTPTPTTAPYKTRIMVVRPNDPEKFNGTVLFEWENVTGQFPAQPGAIWLHNYMISQGYAYVAVNAQKVGVDFLQKWDPLRYGTLAHPGDDYSYDVFSQAVAAVRDPAGIIDPMDGLEVERAIGYGQSQSSGRLNNYLVQAQNDAEVLDGMITQAGGDNKSFLDLQIPFIQFDTEDAVDDGEPNSANPDDLYRLWEVVGTSHLGGEVAGNPSALSFATSATGAQISWEQDKQYWEHSHYGEEGPGAGLTCAGDSEMPVRYALNAALDAMNRKLVDDTALPSPPRALFNGDGTITKDEHGNSVGGLRLPPIDVPVATYRPTECGLLGITVPLSPLTLQELYPTHEVYVTQMTDAISAAVAQRIMLQPDADELLRKAQRSAIPLWVPPSVM